MRHLFTKTIKDLMTNNLDIIFLTADLGYPFLNELQESFPDRFLNIGAAEQSLFDIAVGIALSGKYPICYTITPFILRGFETLRTYVDYEEIPMLIVGSGREKEYYNDGFSHWAIGVIESLKTLTNIKIIEPTVESLEQNLTEIVKSKVPTVITLSK